MSRRNTDERSEAEKALHRERISQLYFKKKLKQVEIAFELGISQATVSRDVKWLKTQLLKAAKRNVQDWQAEALGELAVVKMEAWAAWERSRQNKEVITQQKLPGGNVIETLKTEGQAGDPRFLGVITGAINEEMKIVGGEAATRLKFGDGEDGGAPIINIMVQEIPARAADDTPDPATSEYAEDI